MLNQKIPLSFFEGNTVEKNVLVVCTGNLFRSPLAAAFIQRALEQDHLRDRVLVTSAGLDATAGSKAPDSLLEVVSSKYQIDLSKHQARPITPELFQRADLVLAMEQQQIMRLAQQYPRQSRKLRLISELSGKIYNISDPAIDSDAELPKLATQLYELIQSGLITLLCWLELEN